MIMQNKPFSHGVMFHFTRLPNPTTICPWLHTAWPAFIHSSWHYPKIRLSGHKWVQIDNFWSTVHVFTERNILSQSQLGKKARNYNTAIFICVQKREPFMKYSPFHSFHICNWLRPCSLDWIDCFPHGHLSKSVVLLLWIIWLSEASFQFKFTGNFIMLSWQGFFLMVRPKSLIHWWFKDFGVNLRLNCNCNCHSMLVIFFKLQLFKMILKKAVDSWRRE